MPGPNTAVMTAKKIAPKDAQDNDGRDRGNRHLDHEDHHGPERHLNIDDGHF
jgi:hypothetical protein